MSVESENNKRIARNTIFLYVRMILVMGVTLFTSRIILQALGEENYGIYNVVGGIVAMFGFFSSTLASTSQRYFSYYIGRGDKVGLVRTFKLNMTVFLLFALIVLILAETIGLRFINTNLNISYDRKFAMNCVYQCALIGFLSTIILVPYNALIIAFERMSAFAYISVVEVLLKLVLAISILYIPEDKLILYAVTTLITNVFITIYYYWYCRRNFPECKYQFYWNKLEFTEVLSYSGWHLLGALSVMIRSQGVNVLINIFFSPVVNAGRAIAFQVSTAIDSLSNNFFLAAKPQIYKYYAQRNFEELHKLLLRSTKVCFYLILIIAVPVIVNTESILSIWLRDVPSYAVVFTQLSLLNAIIDSTNGPAIAAALATAKIKWFEIITSSLMIMNLPISYIVLKLGGNPEYTVVVSIIISLITIIVRAYILKLMINLSMKRYMIFTIIPLLFVAVSGLFLSYIFSSFIVSSILDLIVTTVLSVLFISFLFYFIALNNNERIVLSNYLRKVIRKNCDE